LKYVHEQFSWPAKTGTTAQPQREFQWKGAGHWLKLVQSLASCGNGGVHCWSRMALSSTRHFPKELILIGAVAAAIVLAASPAVAAAVVVAAPRRVHVALRC